MNENSVNGFEKIISQIDKDSFVLDVGASGHEGENTTNYLIKRFENYFGICIQPEKVEAYKDNHPEAHIIVGDFYKHKFKDKFDVVVLDLNIENNVIQDWSLEGLQNVRELLNDGGILINYVMTTDQYGDADVTPALIRKRWVEFWKVDKLTNEAIGKRLENIPGFDLFAHEVEERRPYIMWVGLKKK